MSCKPIDNAERRNGLSRVWKVYCYVQALVALQFPSDLVQCFVPIMHEMWKDVILNNLTYHDFELLKVIGRGPSTKALLARTKTDRKIYVLKIYKKCKVEKKTSARFSPDPLLNSFSDQVCKYELLKMDCPFLCKHHAFFQDEKKFYAVTDYLAGGELFFQLQRVKRFSEDRCRFYTAQLVVAVEYLHKNGIICREIKPENLLLSNDGNLVLTDYFILKDQLNLERYSSWTAISEYSSPEVLNGEQIGKAADYWSIGNLLFEMLTGLPPFYREHLELMYPAILTAEIPYPDYVTGAVRDLISKLLERDVRLRTEFGEKMRSHEWFAPIDFQLLSELKIHPPYRPRLERAKQCSSVDPFFLPEQPNWEDERLNAGADFLGFTFVPTKDS